MDKPMITTTDSHWKSLYRVGGMAALLAGVIFRRNIGAEISLFGMINRPDTVSDWFRLLQDNKLIGLAYLNLFDVLDYLLLGLMFLALYASLSRFNKSVMAIATALGWMGIAVYLASNTALSMLSLSNQYTAATTEAQKTMLLAAGQELLAVNDIIHPSTGIYMSFLLIALAGLLTSIVMLRSTTFSRASAYFGILASIFDLAYCLAFIFVPARDIDTAALSTIPAAGLFLMIWHILVGWRLLQLANLEEIQA